MRHVLAIDQGTTGSTCLVVREDGRVMGRAYREITQHYPSPGLVEHEPSEILASVRAATTVRVRSGRLTVTDGPVAETREQLGGFFLIEARDLNEAIRVASRIPPARIGGIEVPPLDDSQMLLTGGADYNDMCAGCHLRPGQTESVNTYRLTFPDAGIAWLALAAFAYIIVLTTSQRIDPERGTLDSECRR
mgnify:CR=1 FL=1